MPDFEKMTPELSHLFLRIDAAGPTDPTLVAAADLWRARRGSDICPRESLWRELPSSIHSHAFLVHKAPDGTLEWIFLEAGSSASLIMGGDAGTITKVTEPELAIRLHALFDLVERKGEPYAAMFELAPSAGHRRLCEVYAAPLLAQEPRVSAQLAVLSWREEAM
jgi:hypothetical protein